MSEKKWSDDKIKEEVKNQYGTLVTSESSSSCCGPVDSCCGPTETMKGNLVKSAGYSDSELQTLPSEAVENSFGCGNPLAFAGVEEGQTVLDIGSGAGIDCFLAADKVGKSGKIIGLDMTPEMIQKATENAQKGGYTQVEFRMGEAENMPVEDSRVDWVISNCVINLSPDKKKVFSEISRILKPGGQISISDIVLGDDLPDFIANSIYAWTGCIAGAIKETEYLQGLRDVGLTDVEVESRIVYEESMLQGFVEKYEAQLNGVDVRAIMKQVVGKIWSAKIVGKKS